MKSLLIDLAIIVVSAVIVYLGKDGAILFIKNPQEIMGPNVSQIFKMFAFYNLICTVWGITCLMEGIDPMIDSFYEKDNKKGLK